MPSLFILSRRSLARADLPELLIPSMRSVSSMPSMPSNDMKIGAVTRWVSLSDGLMLAG